MLKCVENCGPRHPPKRVPWARFKKKITIESKSYASMPLYLFFDFLLSTCPKKMETEKWPKAADSPIGGTNILSKNFRKKKLLL